MHWKGETRGTVQIKVLLVSVNGKGDKTWRQHSAARDVRFTIIELRGLCCNDDENWRAVFFSMGSDVHFRLALLSVSMRRSYFWNK